MTHENEKISECIRIFINQSIYTIIKMKLNNPISVYMILEFHWQHAFNQRISNHQPDDNMLNDHFFSLTYSLKAKYLMSMCFLRLQILLFLAKNIAAEFIKNPHSLIT